MAVGAASEGFFSAFDGHLRERHCPRKNKKVGFLLKRERSRIIQVLIYISSLLGGIIMKFLIPLLMIVGSALLPITSHAAPLEKVSIQLKWFHQFQFAGYYAAKEKGFYADLPPPKPVHGE